MDKTYSTISRLMTVFVDYDRGMPKQIQHALYLTWRGNGHMEESK